MWSDLCEMAGLEQMKDIPYSVTNELNAWQAIFDSRYALSVYSFIYGDFSFFTRVMYVCSDPHRAQFPFPFGNVTPLERLCILRCLRRDKMELAIQDFITQVHYKMS